MTEADRYLCRASDLAQQPDLMALPEVIAPPCGVAGRVTLLTHGPKGGKSSTGAAIVADAARRGVRGAILTLDEAMADTLQRLVRYGALLDRIWLAEYFDPESLEAEVGRLSVELLIVDHLGKIAEAHPDFAAGSQGDPLLWGLVAPFTTLARARNLAVVLLDQARKSDGKYSGSTAKAGSVDLLVEMESKDGGLEATPRGRIPLPPFRVELDEEGIPRFSGGVRMGNERPATATDDKSVLLLRLLADSEPEGLASTSWMKLAGLPKQTYHTHRHALLTQGLALSPQETRTARYRITDKGEASLVPQVPTGTAGTTVPVGGIGTTGTKPLIKGLDRGTSQPDFDSVDDSEEGTERLAIEAEGAS